MGGRHEEGHDELNRTLTLIGHAQAMKGPGSAMTAGRARLVLGVAPGADAEALSSAFRAAVKGAHPDHGGDAEHLRDVVEAHRVLKALAAARFNLPPARRSTADRRPPPPRLLRLEISVLEALFGGERRLEADPGRLIDVRLPAGLRSGEALRLKHAGPGGGALLLRIVIAAEEALSVRGHDLWLTASAGADQLDEGARLEIDTPRGRRAIQTPAGADAGAALRLRGEGLPARGPHPVGDLIVRLVREEAVADEPAARTLLRRFAARWAA